MRGPIPIAAPNPSVSHEGAETLMTNDDAQGANALDAWFEEARSGGMEAVTFTVAFTSPPEFIERPDAIIEYRVGLEVIDGPKPAGAS